MLKRSFLLYVAGGQLTEFHKRSPWIMIPISFNEIGFSAYLVCSGYELREHYDITVLETSIRKKNLFSAFYEPFVTFARILEIHPDYVMMAPTGAFLLSAVPLVGLYRTISRVINKKRTYFILKTDSSQDFTGVGRVKKFISKILLVLSTFAFNTVSFETPCAIEKAFHLPMLRKNKVELIPIGYPHKFMHLHSHDIPGREQVILCVARIARQKGQDVLLRAFSQIADEHEGWRIHIVGPTEDPNYMSELKSIISQVGIGQKVEFMGFLEESDLQSEFLHASIFCLPSVFRENAGQVKYEATAYGLPVVTSDKPCPVEALDMGWVVADSYNVKELARSLSYLMSDADVRCSTVDKAQSRLNNYKEIVQRYVK